MHVYIHIYTPRTNCMELLAKLNNEPINDQRKVAAFICKVREVVRR